MVGSDDTSLMFSRCNTLIDQLHIPRFSSQECAYSTGGVLHIESSRGQILRERNMRYVSDTWFHKTLFSMLFYTGILSIVSSNPNTKVPQ